MTNLILCGGAGTRLWPISRTSVPKQYFQLFGKDSLFGKTAERNKSLCEKFFIAGSVDTAFIAQKQLSDAGLSSCRALFEPVGRNTAPALALTALAVDPKEVIFVTPSDHVIADTKAYEAAVKRAEVLAKEGYLVTFGLKPEYPETGFGYIEYEGETVVSFKEKPDALTAQKYMESGRYLWNSGMFCFQAGVFLEELGKYQPGVLESCKQVIAQCGRDGDIKPERKSMEHIPSISVDYAVMEKSQKIRVVPCSIGWSDLGSFDSLYDFSKKDPAGNALLGQDTGVVLNSQNNLVFTQNREVALVDVNDLLVVDTPDALVVCKKGSSQKVKDVVGVLQQKNPNILKDHVTVPRPWGQYTVLLDAPDCKVKRIEVNPGKRLSLQKHHHRQEHWVVVAGTARVTVGKEVKDLQPNDHVHIPLGEVHRLENPKQDLLIIVETQLGTYFGEDDIIRIEDDFHRV